MSLQLSAFFGQVLKPRAGTEGRALLPLSPPRPGECLQLPAWLHGWQHMEHLGFTGRGKKMQKDLK